MEKQIDNKFSNKKQSDIDLLNEIYSKTHSVRQTAKELKMDRTTVTKYLTDENFEIFTNKKTNRTTKTQSDYVVDWRKRTKIKLVEYKGGCCVKCGYNKSVNVLQFHHLDPKEKDFTIGGKSFSFERLKIEVDKCILVCANCHIEIHEELNKI